MAGKPSTHRSPSGIRSKVFVASGKTWSQPIRVNPKVSFLGEIPSTSRAIGRWPYATSDDFDDAYSLKAASSSVYDFPVNRVRFDLGNDGYIPTDDGVPGTNRVRQHRIEGYSFDLEFPIIISGASEADEPRKLGRVYEDVIGPFVRNGSTSNSYPSLHSIMLGSSQQVVRSGDKLEVYPGVLESFDINVSGVGGASSINCSMRVRGILKGYASRLEQMKHAFPQHNGVSVDSNYTMDTRGAADVMGVDPDDYGGRLGTIKDCVVRLGDNLYQQVIDIKMRVANTLEFVSHSGRSSVMSHPSFLLNYADAIYLTQRVVSGSFSFLAPSVISGVSSGDSNTADIFPFSSVKTIDSTPASEQNSLEQYQWSSPLFMQFGGGTDASGEVGIAFDMPAVYWQPTHQELSPSVALVTVDFLARSNVVGGSEFN